MKKIVLSFATALIPLAMGATAADAQRVIVGPGYDRGGGVVVYRGGPVYRGARFAGCPRYVYGPRRYVRYGAAAGFVGAYPSYRTYTGGCYRWRLVPTPIGMQWRMVNLCYAPVQFVPAYPYRYRGIYTHY